MNDKLLEQFKKIQKSSTMRKDFEEAKKKLYDGLVELSIRREAEIKEVLDMVVKKGRKKFIEDSIISYRASFNEEYIEHLKNIKKLRERQANVYASTPDKELRLLLELPQRLHNYFRLFLNPPFPENEKEARWFAKKYKEFCVAEKI